MNSWHTVESIENKGRITHKHTHTHTHLSLCPPTCSGESLPEHTPVGKAEVQSEPHQEDLSERAGTHTHTSHHPCSYLENVAAHCLLVLALISFSY